ncbi:MAG: rod shape-determining protein MreC [Alistipes sp.]|nr:rod shape-determining protein MreC [Alistipes sp.]MBO7264556.1 rod shape-determining protein MreC [Alistipes sp.]
MYRLLEFIKRIYVLVIFLILESMALLNYATSTPYTEAKILARTTAAGAAISGAISDVGHFFSLPAQNRELTARIAELSAVLGDVEQEVSVTVDSVDHHFKYHAARVVSMTTNRPQNHIVLDRGSLDGISKDMGVVTPNNELVGYVLSCTEHYSIVQSMLNTQFNTGGCLVDNGNVCVIGWDGSSRYQVQAKDLSVYSEPQRGMAVEVRSERLPEGVLIGTIDEFKLNNTQTAYSATITIAAKMAMLDNVLIVENTRASELDELHKQVEGKK